MTKQEFIRQLKEQGKKEGLKLHHYKWSKKDQRFYTVDSGGDIGEFYISGDVPGETHHRFFNLHTGACAVQYAHCGYDRGPKAVAIKRRLLGV